jgi:hypothetical protein
LPDNLLTYEGLVEKLSTTWHIEGLTNQKAFSTLATLVLNDENYDILRRVSHDVLGRLVVAAEQSVDELRRRATRASTVPLVSGESFTERDVVAQNVELASMVVSLAAPVLEHLSTHEGKHPVDGWIRERDERIATEAAETALWQGFENLRGFERAIANHEDRDDMWNTLNALVEAGVPVSLLGFHTVQPIYCMATEPDDGLDTDFDDELVQVLDHLGFRYRIDERIQPRALIIESDGEGYDWRKGKRSAGWTPQVPALDGWRQLPTSSLEQVHLALLACSDHYWDVMPARLKTASFVEQQLPALFKVPSVYEIPRAAIREQAIGVLKRDLAVMMTTRIRAVDVAGAVVAPSRQVRAV